MGQQLFAAPNKYTVTTFIHCTNPHPAAVWLHVAPMEDISVKLSRHVIVLLVLAIQDSQPSLTLEGWPSRTDYLYE